MPPLPPEVEEIARLWGVYRSTIDATVHPVDDLDGWRERWAQLRELAEEIDRVAADRLT